MPNADRKAEHARRKTANPGLVKSTQARATANRNAQRKLLLDRLRSVPCADCRQVFLPYCMDFDHLPQFKKVGAVMAMAHGSLEKLITEIAKCEVVCAICHRHRTVNRRKAQS